MTSVTKGLPRWDMAVVYPGIDSPEFRDGFQTLPQDIDDLTVLFDEHNVAGDVAGGEPAPLDDERVRAFDDVTARYNAVLERVMTLSAYIRSFVTTDSRDDRAQAALSRLQRHLVALSQLGTRYTAWIGSLDVEGLVERSETARAHAFALRHAGQAAAHLMPPAEEALAAELEVTGGVAWGKLHGNLTSQLVVRIERDGEIQELPMSSARNAAFDEDRDLRRRAYEAELATWRAAALPLAAALNSVKGEDNTLAARRRWASPLDAAVFDNSIDRRTLDAMMQAAHESFPDFRRYLRAKARALGVPALAWYDLLAPVGAEDRAWPYDEAAAFIVKQFGTYSSRLSDFAARAFAESWIDAEPRPGKRDGAFCMWLRAGESRILANYSPTFEGLTTLAHELGHGYHNLNLAACAPLQRGTPMTLAETASIFCETIIFQAGLRQTDDAGQAGLLNIALQGSCQVVVDITSRFLFEERVFTERRERELSIDDLNRFMLDAQRATYGDGLDEETLHPYMWAVKGHYYNADRPFYNYPYMFGLLFGLGLYARYQADPDGFKEGYDDLLSSTGLADAATLARRFGITLDTPDFWRSSLDVVRADIDRFERLVVKGTVGTA